MFRVFWSICTLALLASSAHAADSPQVTTSGASANDFALVQSGLAAKVVYATADAKVVETAARLFADDVQRVSSVRPEVATSTSGASGSLVIIGTVGKSPSLDGLIAERKVNVSGIQGGWERYHIEVVKDPLPGVAQALVVAGSDRRGTAYGVFSLSEAMGVSPWYWWADVQTALKTDLFVSATPFTSKEPSVRYRGIFINDEDWGLQPWAAKNFEPEVGNIGPKTYAKVCELLLRLKANYLWPAMHERTSAFNSIPRNKIVADDYAIVMGSSHAEPMLFNNASEWKHPKNQWSYDTHAELIKAVWENRLQENGKYENCYTVGIRGIHDRPMQGGGTVQDGIRRLEQVFADQRALIARYVDPKVERVPQVFVPYKEVLPYYQQGLKVPDDVTLVWVDDNFGYIRQLSKSEDRKRTGGAGVYYHFSYWGEPEDFLWIGSTSPGLTAYEMGKAYAYGADRVWVFNVGDIKLIEKEMEFAMRLAYDIDSWPAEKAMGFLEDWAARTFVPEHAKAIAAILKEYYRLAAQAKPEHRHLVTFTKNEQEQRLIEYSAISQRAEAIHAQIPPRLKDAFFQLVVYPVKGAALMDRKHAGLAQGNADMAVKAYDEIQQLTARYNKEIAAGKWNHMVCASPRNRRAFQMPDAARDAEYSGAMQPELTPAFVLAAADYRDVENTAVSKWKKLEGLGLEKHAMALLPYEAPSIPETNLAKAPAITYSVNGQFRKCTIEPRFLPTHHVNHGMRLRYAISVDGGPAQIKDINAPEYSRMWSKNVLQGYASASTTHASGIPSTHTITIHLLDPGMVLSQVRVFTE